MDSPPPATAPAGLRVLLLDDDPFMLAMLSEMIAGLGPHTVQCQSSARLGLEALRRAAPDQPDLLVCDLGMPDMDGIELLRHAAALRFGGQVLLLSGMDGGVLRAAERLALAQGLRVLAACAKPLPPAALAALLALAAARGPATA